MLPLSLSLLFAFPLCQINKNALFCFSTLGHFSIQVCASIRLTEM